MMKICVSIINYHKNELVVKNLHCLAKQSLADILDVVLVDNNECDKLRDGDFDLEPFSKIFKSFRLIEPGVNSGYTLATNFSIDVTSDYFFLINPDIEVDNTTLLSDTIKYLKNHESVGLVGVKHIDPDGNVESIVRSFPSLLTQIMKRLPILRNTSSVSNYTSTSLNHSKSVEVVDWVQSSFWGVKTEAWRCIGGFDKRFFLFMNEPDYCHRLLKASYETHYLGHLSVRSDGVRCSGGGLLDIFRSKALQVHVLDSLKYYLKVVLNR